MLQGYVEVLLDISNCIRGSPCKYTVLTSPLSDIREKIGYNGPPQDGPEEPMFFLPLLGGPWLLVYSYHG